jgi:predicted Zn-dependent peptidase
MDNKTNGTQQDKITFYEHELNNGLRIIIAPDNSIPSVVINICYHVGSKDEDMDKKGFAHLFEHLMFEGSKNIPSGDFDRYCLMAGGDNNAYTTEDKTNYYVTLPSNQLELGLWLESDRMLQFAITEESLKTQKGVVIEEKKQNFDNRPFGSLSLEFPPRLFPNSIYGWDTIGDVKDIKNAKMGDIKTFYEKYYVPNNAVLTVAGDVDPDETLMLIKKYFGGIKRGTYTKQSFNISRNGVKASRDVIKDNIQFPGIFIGYKMPAENTKENYALELFADILSQGESSRIYKELVYEKQLCGEAGAYVDSKEFAGVFYAYALLMPDVSIEETEHELNKIIKDSFNGSITDKELQKAKNKSESKNTLRKQSILSKADLLTHFKIFYNDADLINNHVQRYLEIDKEYMEKVAAEYLTDSNKVTLIYIPKNNK